MTKKLLLKWLEQQKNKAFDIVNRQEAAAKAELNEKKYRDTGLEALVAEISPKLNEVYGLKFERGGGSVFDTMLLWRKR